jgi:hypothetical protein
MDNTSRLEIEQEARHLQIAVKMFFDNFPVGTFLDRSGIRKLKGSSPLTVFEAIFMLTFWGQNFYRVTVLNEQLGFQKDVAYDLLEIRKLR